MKKRTELFLKTVQIVTLILSCFTVSYAQQPTKTEFGFRNTKWGMTREEVKATEFAGLVEDKDNLLVFIDVIGGNMETLVAYIFADGKLIRGKYLFRTEHVNKNDYITDYKRVKETLKLKYGSPTSDEEIWHDNFYKDEPEKLGIAISIGHLVYRTKWETGTTEISLVLHENKKKVAFGVIYSSK